MNQHYQHNVISNRSGFNLAGRPLFGLVLGGLLLMSGCASTQSYRTSCPVASETVTATQRQAEAGEAASQYQVGSWYVTGKCLKGDNAIATEWFRRAAEQGHTDAQWELGRMYNYGRGIEQDDEQAARWFRQAAEQGQSRSAYSLGALYAKGRGVTRDFDRAEYWYRQAFAGNVLSQTDLDRLLDNLEKIRDPVAWEQKQPRLAEERKQEQQRLAEDKREAEDKAEQEEERLLIARRKAAQEQLGVVAVVVPQIEPDMTNQHKSLAVKLTAPIWGAGEGALGGLYLGTCAGYCPNPATPVIVGLGLVGGFVGGVGVSIVGVSERRAISKLGKVYEDTNPLLGLQGQVLTRGEEVLTNRLVVRELADPTPAIRNGSFAPSGVDTILEIVNVRSRFVESELLSNQFLMVANGRVIRAVDDTVLDEWEVRYEEQSVAVRKWVKNDAKRFREALEAGYIDLADQLLAHLLGLADFAPAVPAAPEVITATNGI